MLAQQLPGVFADISGLGAPEAYFPVRREYCSSNAFGAAFLILLGGLSAAYVVAVTFLGWQPKGLLGLSDLRPSFLLLAAFCFGYGGYTAWQTYRDWNKAVVVYADGIAYYDRRGLLVWRWGEIISIEEKHTTHRISGVPAGVSSVYTLKHAGGGRLKLDTSLGDLHRLVQLVRARVSTNPG